MDDTTFEIHYEVATESPTIAVERATDRLARSLAVGVEYVVRGERWVEVGVEAYRVTLLVELTRLASRLRTNLAFHGFFPDATVDPV